MCCSMYSHLPIKLHTVGVHPVNGHFTHCLEDVMGILALHFQALSRDGVAAGSRGLAPFLQICL